MILTRSVKSSVMRKSAGARRTMIARRTAIAAEGGWAAGSGAAQRRTGEGHSEATRTEAIETGIGSAGVGGN